MKLFILLLPIIIVAAEISNKIDKNPRIFGGKNAEIEEFPSLAAIINIEEKVQFCTGSFVSEIWILTAAHCNLDINNFVIEYETTNLLITDQDAKILLPEIFIPHEKYNADEFSFDIALIKTKDYPQVTRLSSIIAKLAIPGSHFSLRDKATVVGWGILSNMDSTTPPLQKADLQIYSSSSCAYYYRDNIFEKKIFPHQICAGAADFTIAECSGDSGGPLFVNGIQVGVMSFSVNPCNASAYPGVYTDVRHFIPWIQEKTGLEFEINSFLIRRQKLVSD